MLLKEVMEATLFLEQSHLLVEVLVKCGARYQRKLWWLLCGGGHGQGEVGAIGNYQGFRGGAGLDANPFFSGGGGEVSVARVEMPSWIDSSSRRAGNGGVE